VAYVEIIRQKSLLFFHYIMILQSTLGFLIFYFVQYYFNILIEKELQQSAEVLNYVFTYSLPIIYFC